MSDVMTQCVPVATGALTPDQRVNYLFGLVLGVDEFQQEDLYFRERDERANRTLHGYGTTVGLDVTADRPEAAPDDVEVKVSRGVLVDQPGRSVVIPTAQCARVGAWIAAQEEAAAAEEKPPPREPLSPRATSLCTSSPIRTFVPTGSGAAGKPCGSDTSTAPSDCGLVEYRLPLEPPGHPNGTACGPGRILVHVDLDEMSPLDRRSCWPSTSGPWRRGPSRRPPRCLPARC